jgi:hypothetical protein
MKNISIMLILSGFGLMSGVKAHPIASITYADKIIGNTSGNTSDNISTDESSILATGRVILSNSFYYLHEIRREAEENSRLTGFDKRQKAREALLPLLRGVFNTRRKDIEVMLTIDAGWRNDSLSIEYKYYKGNNLLALNDSLLVETIYFTVNPEEIDAIDTEQDEFQFLYLRNKKKRLNVHHLVRRASNGVTEESWCSSFGFPVRAENLPVIIQLLKDLRSKD